ncbi:MAG: two-component regulator propeller domain-containing protein [Cyclobacteriaceae bacterium]
MRKLLAILCIVLSNNLFSQKGDFLLKHHFPTNPNIDNTNFEILSDNNGLICLANRAGVLTYDGDSWDFFGTPSAALSIDIDTTNTIYVGSIGTFGKIDIQENAFLYQSLIETDTINDLFFQTRSFGNCVYFLGNHNLGIYNQVTKEVSMLQDDFVNLFRIEDELFINTQEETFKVISDSLIEVQLKVVVSTVHHRENRPPLVVDFDGEVYIWNKRFISIGHNKLISENGFEIEEAKWINDSLIACSTFSNGVLFLNYNDLDYFEVTDYNSGLPDNEIYAMHADNRGEVWIAHPFGLTSVSPLFPAFSYSNFPGLKGNLTGVFQKKDNLWVSTSLGLFHFDTDTIFKNQVYYTQVTRTRAPTPAPKVESKTSSEKKTSKLKGLFKKRNRTNSSAEKKTDSKTKKFFSNLVKSVEDVFDHPDNTQRVSRKQAKNTSYKRNVRKVPVRINHHFAKVDGTDGKFFDLIEYDHHLLLIGNSGVYEIKDRGSELVIAENIRTAISTSTGQLLISTYDLHLKSFTLEGDIWIEQNSEELEDIIVNIKEDKDGHIWLAGSSSLYNLSLSDSSFSFTQTYPLSNQYLDDVDIMERSDTTYFINSQGYFYYDKSSDQIKENKTLISEIGVAVSSISEPSKDQVWVNNGKHWYLIPEKGEIRKFEHMSLFKDLVSISAVENSEEFWLLTRDNQLLKYNPRRSSKLATYDLFVKKLTNQKGVIDKRLNFSLSYDENFLTVELSKPDFLGLLNSEFQYKLNGLHTEWSEWSKSKSIDFSYLPPGAYSLSVRSKDAFGRLEEVNMLDFKVKSPYWQRPWFYALQIFFFGALVIVSSRLNQSKTQNQLLSGGLSVLTLILIIEFIQSAAGAFLNVQSTPVVDFLIDVFVALLIFPLEKFLREFLSKGKIDASIADVKALKRKKQPSSN